jgi:hypothetical protein
MWKRRTSGIECPVGPPAEHMQAHRPTDALQLQHAHLLALVHL